VRGWCVQSHPLGRRDPRNDTVNGGDGNDGIHGGGGDDTADGGAGNDRIHAGQGADNVTAGAGDDVVWVRDHKADTVDRGAGDDTVYADKDDTPSTAARLCAGRVRSRRRRLTPPYILCIHTRYALPGPRFPRHRARARL
jgi:hypothetical protein